MTKISLRNPVAVLMGGVACALLGVLVVRQLPLDLFPQIDVPVIMVGTLYPGASPEVVERTVSYRIERAVSQTANLDYVSSQSRYGLSIVRGWYRWGTNIDAAQLQVSQEVSSILKNLPRGIYPPFVVAFDVSNIPVANIVLESDELDEKTMYDLATNVIQPQLSSLPGISYASPTGGKVREIVVRLDPDRLRARAIDVSDVEKAVMDSNLLMSAGDVKIGTLNYNVFTNSQVENVEALNKVVVKTVRGVPVHLADVGAAVDGTAIQVNLARINGRRGMYMSIYRQPGTNAVEVVDALKEVLPKLTGVPASVKMTVAFDQAKFVRASLRALQHEAVQGTVLAVLVIALFLGSLRSTFIVFLSLPLSVLATFVGLQVAGETLNTFTLLGLTLVASRIIDNAIVVLENIHRHLKEHKTPLQAAYDGATEVALPVLASSLVTVIVFAPVVMVEGVAKFLFTPMLVTMALGMAASFVVAVTVVPALCRRLLKHEHHHAPANPVERVLAWAQHGVDRLDHAYERTLRKILARPRAITAGTVLLLLGALCLVPLIGSEFFPAADESQFRVVLRTPIGTRLEETERQLEQMETIVRQVIPKEHLKTLLGNAGTPRGSRSAFYSTNSGPHAAYLQVELVPPGERDVSADQYVQKLRPALKQAMPGRTLSFDPGGVMKKVLNFGFAAPINVEISGYDLNDARETARKVAQVVGAVPGIKDVLISREENFPQLDVTVDREKAALAGVTQRDAAKTLLGSLLGNYSTAPYFEDPQTGNQYNIVTRVAPELMSHLEDLGNLPIVNKEGAPVYLKAISEITRGSGPVQIDRRRLQRVVEVTANPEGRDLGSVSADVRKALDVLQLPPGFAIRLRGQTEIQERTFKSLSSAALLALALVYMLLASQFRSFLQPLIMMVSVPLGLIGVFAALAVTRTTLSTTSFIGVIMMVGVAVSNGVLLLDFANNIRRQGVRVRKAIVMAGRARLRPILMTSLATLLGLLPMALGVGEGSETNAPLARAVVGGLLVSTVLTLLFVPVLYAWVERRFGKRVDLEEERALEQLGGSSVIATLLAFALSQAPAPPAELSLDQALARTVAAQPLLRAAQQRRETTEHQLDAARGALFPQVSLQAQGFVSTSNNAPVAYLSPTDIARVGTRPAARAGDSEWMPYPSELLGVGAHQAILDFAAFGQLDAAKANVDAAGAGYAYTLQQLLLRTAEAFYRAVAAVEDLAAATAAFQRAKTQRLEAEAGVKAGLKPALDAARAVANEAAAELRVHEAGAAADINRAALALAMGEQELAPDVTLTRPPEGEGAGPTSPVPVRADVQVLQAERRAALARAQAARGLGLPRLFVTSSVSLRGFASAPSTPNWDVGLIASVPIYLGGGPTALAEAELSQAAELEARERALARAAAYQVLEADRLLTASTRGLTAAQRQFEAAKAGLEQAEARYKLGLGGIVELVDAQTQLASAEQAVVRGRLNIGLSRARLLYARGELAATP